MASLSDLEHTVLGLVWKHGPCTRYQIRKQFIDSPSSHWTGSAGAIYPLVAKLEDRGLVESKSVQRDRRHSRIVRITSAGRKTLKTWLKPPLSSEAAEAVFDAVRTRAFFIGLLTTSERTRFLEDVREALKEHAKVVAAYCESRRESGDEFGYLASRGAVHAARARLAWVDELRQHFR